MHTEEIDYWHGGRKRGGYFACNDAMAGKRPGILVIHDLWGLGEQPKERARKLAELGYVALAVDLYGDRRQPTALSEALPLVDELRSDNSRFRSLLRAGLDTLRRHPLVDGSRLAAIGFCLGGIAALELARDGADLRGVVCFHGNLDTPAPAQAGQVKAGVLVCTGGDDPLIPGAQITAFQDEMKHAEVDWQVNVYGGAEHSFTNIFADRAGIPGVRYHRNADLRSWEAMRQFLIESFGD
ncbi:Dienelactone hydrolase-like enzyme [Cupriavidus oxalaticus]|uniref:dienelactone hydrolase family protein n=1 Tax=Cupriavidus oxalaticus TaxID=96344 RepID=UPI003F738DE2